MIPAQDSKRTKGPVCHRNTDHNGTRPMLFSDTNLTTNQRPSKMTLPATVPRPTWSNGGLDPEILFRIGINASRYTVGEPRLLRRTRSLRSRSAIKSDTTSAQTKTTFVEPSSTSLEMVANRYHMSGSMDTQWGLETQRNAVIISMAYDDSARRLAISMSDGRVRIIDLPNWINLAPEEQVDLTETILEDKEIIFPSISPATTIKWCPNRNNQVVSGYVKGLIKYWNIDTEKCLHTIETGNASITSMCYNPFEKKFAASSNNKIFIFDEQKQKVEQILASGTDPKKMDGHTSKIFQVLYHPFQRSVIFSGGWDNAILIWDERTPHAVAKIAGPHICGLSMDVSNNNHLLVGSWRRESNVQIFDLNTLELLKEIDQLSDYRRRGTPYTQPYAARFLGHDHIAICGSHNTMLKIFDKKDFSLKGCLTDAEASMFCMDIPKTRLDYPLVVGSGNDIHFLDWHSMSKDTAQL